MWLRLKFVMSSPTFPRPRLFVASLVTALLAACSVVQAAPARAVSFDVHAGPAIETLKQAAQQAGREIMFPADTVRGVRTPALQGDYTPLEALQRLLAGSGLVVDEDESTGALAVRPATVGPVPSPGVNPGKTPAPAPVATGENETLSLDPYEIHATKETGVINQGVIPREPNQALRYEIIDRNAIERAGVTTLPELFRQVSSVSNFGTGSQASYASQMTTTEGVAITSDEINLRGLGSNNTLVMVNGRRAYDSENGGVDISRIPLALVERIEILPGSGSAIYGASATAGVVNIVLRKDYQGTELTTSFGSSTAGGAEEFRGTLFHGRTLNNGKTNITVSLDYRHQWELAASDRGYYEAALSKVSPTDQSSYITNIVQSFFGARGTVTASTALGITSNMTARFAAVPAGVDGSTTLTKASFNDTAGIANISTERAGRATLIPETSRYNFATTFEHAIRDQDLGVYLNLNAGYYDRAEQRYVGLLGALTLAATNRYNPFGKAVQVYMDPTDLPKTVTKADQSNVGVVTGIKGQHELFARPIKWSVDVSWNRNESNASNVDYTRLVRGAVTNGLYNPLRDMSVVAPLSAEEAAKFYSRYERRSTPEIAATNWRVNGGLFDTWGGEARVSLGAEVRLENQFIDSQWRYGDYGKLTGAGTQASTTTDTYRRAFATYSEVTIPLIGERNRRPWAHALDISAAMRYEEYDDFGSAAPPMTALRFAPTKDVMVRASWSRGFQPPLQNQLFEPVTVLGPYTSVLFTDPLRPGLALEPYTLVSGGNASLKAETSDSYDAGVVITPRWLPGLTLNASYFRYDKRDVVALVDRQAAIDYPDLFPGRVVRAAATAADIAAGRPGAITSIDTSYTNIAKQLVDGWDFSGSYQWDTDAGKFTVRSDATYTMAFRQQLRPNLPLTNSVGNIGSNESVPLVWRGKVGLEWQKSQWGAAVTGRYVDSYVGITNTATTENPSGTGLDGAEIPSSFEVDLQVSYSFAHRMGRAAWFNGSQISLSVLNVADREPPLRTQRANQWYSLFNDPRQRYITLSFKKAL